MLSFPPRTIIEVIEDGCKSADILCRMASHLHPGPHIWDLIDFDRYVPQRGKIHRIGLVDEDEEEVDERIEDVVRHGLMSGYGKMPLAVALLLIEMSPSELTASQYRFVHQNIRIPRPNRPEKRRDRRLMYVRREDTDSVSASRVNPDRMCQIGDGFAFAIP